MVTLFFHAFDLSFSSLLEMNRREEGYRWLNRQVITGSNIQTVFAKIEAGYNW